MAGRSEAYDFSLFEVNYDNAVPVREPERVSRENVVEFPQQEQKRSPRRKLHPIRALVVCATFAAFVVLAAAMVYSQEQLAMLTEQINIATQQLEESKSLEVQLNMAAAQRMSGTQVEDYAENQLGMSKITSRQVTYVNVAQQDRGTVVRSTDGGSFLDKALAAIRNWFAE